MAPKRSATVDEADEIRQSLTALALDIANIREDQKKVLTLMEELRQANKQKDEIIRRLESRVEDLEQYSRMNNIIMTGLKIKPRSFASAVTGTGEGGVPSEEDTHSAEQQVVSFLQGRGVHLDPEDLEACHALPSRHREAKPTIILRFANRKRKNELMKQGRNLRGTDVYLNDHLTKKNSEIAGKARHLKRNKKIQGTWVRNCRVFIKLNNDKVVVIREIDELQAYENQAAN